MYNSRYLNPAKACSNMFALDGNLIMIDCLGNITSQSRDGIGMNVVVNITDI